MRLSKEQLTKKGLRRREITIPDSDGTLLIRELSTDEVREYAAKFKATADDEEAQLELTADLVMRGVVDEHGQPFFGPEEGALVRGMSLATMSFIAREVSKLSGMSVDEKKSPPRADR